MKQLTRSSNTVDISRSLPVFIESQFVGISKDERATQETFNYYQERFLSSDKAQQFLFARGIKNLELLDQLGIGYCDRSLGKKLRALSKWDEQAFRGSMQRVGLIKSSGHEVLRGAITVPFYSLDEQIVGAYGRRICPKLRSGTPYHVHWLTDATTFFNLGALNHHSEIILCKNPLDALVWLCHGFSNVIALMGARNYLNQHALIFDSYHINKVLLAFGGSREALVYSRKIIRLNTNLGIETKILISPQGLATSDYALTLSNPYKGLMQSLSQPYILE
ncbi:toprim domain-containing protein [Kangiella sp. TOML190]|uniref:toprim domain-containing protein n=1 Tax=Kangiella sp. TOML190 TaxID=2931351 RepID=UPI00203FE110|nr:hypothetical protein [Kangiella sp. TOML190]